MVTGFSVHHDARGGARGAALDGFQFFGYALGHHYIFGEHKPGRTDIWERSRRRATRMPDERRRARGIGTPDAAARASARLRGGGRRSGRLHPAGRAQQARAHLRGARAVRARGDAGVQGARNRRARGEEGGELAPYIEKAMARKETDAGARPTPTSPWSWRSAARSRSKAAAPSGRRPTPRSGRRRHCCDFRQSI